MTQTNDEISIFTFIDEDFNPGNNHRPLKISLLYFGKNIWVSLISDKSLSEIKNIREFW